MDAEALTDSLREYFEEIYDLIFLEGDKKEAVERIEVISKFVDDHVHQHPDACFDGVFGATGHLISVLLFLYEYNQKKQAIIQFAQAEQSVIVLDILDSYSETEDPFLLESARSILRNSTKNAYQDMDDQCQKFAIKKLKKRCEGDQPPWDMFFYKFITSRLEEITA